MILIKLVLISSLLFLGIKIYYSIKIREKHKSTGEIMGDIYGGTYGGSVIFPILRKPRDSKEKRLIRKANIAVGLFWSFFLLAMLLILLRTLL
jgi:hypothetical protein